MLPKKMPRRYIEKTYVLLDKIYNLCRGSIYRLSLYGSKYTCPICKYSFRKFLPVGYRHNILKEKKIIGGGYRPNAKCPFCTSIDRERLIYMFLQTNDLLQVGMKILHVAPEKNIQKFIKEKELKYYSADLNSPLANIKMDIQKIPFPADYFDAIICNHVLEHIPDDIKAMKELNRVLKPNGWAILQVPFSSAIEHTFEDATVTSTKDRKLIFGQANHVRIYGLDYPKRLSAANFIATKEKIPIGLIDQYALNPDEVVFFCRK